ncbi:hypothetical protein JHK87_022034 [Glycine soja]|nr:hypothetical protein JHK87_022034 [Glycine soja]
MNLMRGIDLKKIAEKMNGASGAELKAVCTEAGMFALRERRVHVTQEDFEMAMGSEHTLGWLFIQPLIFSFIILSTISKIYILVIQPSFLWLSAIYVIMLSVFFGQKHPNPLAMCSEKDRFETQKMEKNKNSRDEGIGKILGHTYLFLKDQLQPSIMPPHSGILHGTIIDQFIACGKSRDVAHELASRIWLAVVDNLDQNHHSFSLLKRLAHEGDVFLPYPYTRSVKVQWRLFEKLFTDFRDCFNHVDYYDMLGCAKSRFHPIPSAWLGY